MKKKGLVSRVFGLVLLAATYIGLAFDFVMVSTTISSAVSSRTSQAALSLGDFNELLKSVSEKLTWYKFANVLMIVTLVLVGVMLILSIVDMILSNKYVRMITKICSVVGIFVSLAFIVMFIVGGVALSSSATLLGTTTSVAYLPHAAPILITFFALLGSIFTLVGMWRAAKK